MTIAPSYAYLTDNYGVRYKFDAFSAGRDVFGVNAVYAFAAWTGLGWRIHYIGRADILSERLKSHDKQLTATMMGMTHVLVHIPTELDPIPFKEAEKRLIAAYNPPLNVHHRTVAI